MDNNVDKKNAGIESYDGIDAYYEGTDKDYEDFLKQVDDSAVSAGTAGVESSGPASTGETINIKGVIDMVRKKAGEGWSTAKKIGGEVKEQINDYIAAANERSAEKRAETANVDADKPDDVIGGAVSRAESTVEEIIDKAGLSDIPESISSTAKAAKAHIKSASEVARGTLDGLSSIGADIDKLSADMADAGAKLDAVSSKLNEIEVKQIENKNNYDRGVNDIRVSMNCLMNDIAEMSQSTSGIAKLSDAVFDLKNAQQNTKNAISDIEERIVSLRKKMTAGVTIISVLTLIMIVLEIINMLS